MFSQDTWDFFFVSQKTSRIEPNRRAFVFLSFLFVCLIVFGVVCLEGFVYFLKVISTFGKVFVA